MKEKFEWIHSWCDQTDKNDLPRVALIGDSITHNYQDIVRRLLKGRAYVDYVSTSYAVDTDIYNTLIENFVKDSNYDVLHFNFGLHGVHIGKADYKQKVNNLLNIIGNGKKVILANSTIVYEEGNAVVDKKWMARVDERNAALREIAEENNWLLEDLFSISKNMDKKFRYKDGTHYNEEGYGFFAREVVSSIIKVL